MTLQSSPSRSRRLATRGGRVPGVVVIVALVVLTVLVVITSAAVGQVSVSPVEVLGSLAHHLHLSIGPLPAEIGEYTLWNVRFPRIVMGLIVGAALGAGGCLMQGVLANPLAEPGVVGVSSGAAVGAAPGDYRQRQGRPGTPALCAKPA